MSDKNEKELMLLRAFYEESRNILLQYKDVVPVNVLEAFWNLQEFYKKQESN